MDRVYNIKPHKSGLGQWAKKLYRQSLLWLAGPFSFDPRHCIENGRYRDFVQEHYTRPGHSSTSAREHKSDELVVFIWLNGGPLNDWLTVNDLIAIYVDYEKWNTNDTQNFSCRGDA